MKVIRIFCFFFLPLQIGLLVASVHETLPSWHWAYRYIDELRLRCGFEELVMMNRPFTRGDVASGLVKIRQRLEDGTLVISSSTRGLIDRLLQEFRVEIQEIENDKTIGDRFSLGLRFKGDYDKSDEQEGKYRGVYRSKVSVPLGKHVTVYHGLNFDQYMVDDPDYIGKKWNGIVVFTEQAYAAVGAGRFSVKFGRDFLRWGSGRSGTLLFSDATRPMDHLSASARLGPFLYTFMASALDDAVLDSETAERYGGKFAKRYLSAHRLDARFFGGRLQCAVTEAILYGGVHRQVNWNYLNPFIPYHLSQLNNGGRANTLLTVDLIAYPIRQWEIYGSFLIDQEMHLSVTESEELEPQQIGWIVGSRWADPFRIPGLTLSAEYVGVTNRTYKTVHPWETFSHRNVSLGHPLGNDFDYWKVAASQSFWGKLWIEVGYGMMRNGEGGVFTPWDEPWMDVPPEQGYSEPFPTGVVEKRNQVDVRISYYPFIHWGVETEFHYFQKDNANHIEGESTDGMNWRIGVWFNGDMIIQL